MFPRAAWEYSFTALAVFDAARLNCIPTPARGNEVYNNCSIVSIFKPDNSSISATS
ncbi:MAG: hypothetical protein WAX77_05480 [Methylococcaceae bacterium]